MRIFSRNSSSVADRDGASHQNPAANGSRPIVTQPQSSASASSIDAASGEGRRTPNRGAARGADQKSNVEAMAKLAAVQKSVAFTQVVSLMIRSPQHRTRTLADLEWLFLPALQHNQFKIAEAKINNMNVPAGFLLWASVSPDVDKRLNTTSEVSLLMKPEDWRSGDILWVIETVGDPRALRPLLKAFRDQHPNGGAAKVRTTSPDGTVRIMELNALNLEVDAPSARP